MLAGDADYQFNLLRMFSQFDYDRGHFYGLGPRSENDEDLLHYAWFAKYSLTAEEIPGPKRAEAWICAQLS